MKIPMKNGGRIALTHFEAAESKHLPVIVAHGTISNGETILGLATHLMENGFNTWLLEWGGHGNSEAAFRNQDFEYPAFNDFPAAIETVLRQTGAERCYWVSHSGGGHLPLMYFSRHPQEQTSMAAMAALGLQSTDAALTSSRKWQIRAMMAVTRLLGYTPAFILPVGNEGEPTQLLVQWGHWCIDERWYGKDGYDYMAGIGQIHFPFLACVGGNDIIAPESGCRKIFNAIGSKEKSWLLFSEENGYSKSFTHGQLVRGTAAKAEIFPQIVAWLEQMAQNRKH